MDKFNLKPKEVCRYDVKAGHATKDEYRLWRNFTRRIPKHLQKNRGAHRRTFFDAAQIKERAKLGYNSVKIAKDLKINVDTLRKYYANIVDEGNAEYKADCIAEIDMTLVEELTKERYNVDAVMSELGVNLSKTEFSIVANDAILKGRTARPATIAIVEQVPVHQPRFVPYNGKPCANGHRARRIINLRNMCAECHRLNKTKSKKLYDFIGQPRKRDATYKGNKCALCHTFDRYESTNRCVNCTRHHAFNYSRKIGFGTLITKRKTK